MLNTKIKQFLFIILFITISLIISFSITYSLGIPNTVIYRSVTSMFSEITWEIVIFMVLSLIESSIYEVSQVKFENI